MSEFPEIRLIEVSESIQYGLNASAKPISDKSKFLRITDIQNGAVDWSSVPSCDFTEEDRRKYSLNGGDIVFARTGATTGKTFLLKNPPKSALFASYLIRLRLKPVVLPQFINYFFHTPSYWEQITERASGSAQPGVNATKLKSLCIPFPPKKEQTRIVAILDEVFESFAQAHANMEKNLANAQEMFDSYLNRVFDFAWTSSELVTLSELAIDITDGDHSAPPKSDHGIPFITISNIDKKSNIINFDKTFKVPDEYFDSLKANKKPSAGDVLYTVTGSFGIPVLIDYDKKFCFQRHIGLIRPTKAVDSTWLYYLCMSPQFFKQAADRATGTAQKTVSLKVLRSITVPLYPLEKQKIDVGKIKAMHGLFLELEPKFVSNTSLISELRSSILQKAFSGELINKPDKVLNELGA